ncbi:MAG: glutathione S-transferase family protein [Acidobacteriota bacterium]
MKIYGVSVSYFTGKLEAYLRYKRIAYEMESPYGRARELKSVFGAIQVPMVLRDDGRAMSDTTPILQQLEREHPTPAVIPNDPVVRFLSLLIEDYADEWLWRPAMHYRWSYEHDRALLSRILADEVAPHLKVPRWMKLRRLAKRQREGFVVRDGVTEETREHVEASYRTALANMTTMLAARPYLLGGTPSLADFGMMGPMLRHFGQDPTPAEIMRNEAPAVWRWVARVWDAQAEQADLLDDIPDDAAPMLRECCETHLVQLAANAAAHAEGKTHFGMEVQGCRYRRLPVSRYRVWCLEQLRDHFAALDAQARSAVQKQLAFTGADVLWTDAVPASSGYDPKGEAPFNAAINVFGDGVPS